MMTVSVWVVSSGLELIHAASRSWCPYLFVSALLRGTLYMHRRFLDACICVGRHFCVGPDTWSFIVLMPMYVWVGTWALDLIHTASLLRCLYLCRTARLCWALYVQLRFSDACTCVGQHFCAGPYTCSSTSLMFVSVGVSTSVLDLIHEASCS